MKQTESLLDIDTETFIDEDGKYGEPGTEYVFPPNPRRTANRSRKNRPRFSAHPPTTTKPGKQSRHWKRR